VLVTAIDTPAAFAVSAAQSARDSVNFAVFASASDAGAVERSDRAHHDRAAHGARRGASHHRCAGTCERDRARWRAAGCAHDRRRRSREARRVRSGARRRSESRRRARARSDGIRGARAVRHAWARTEHGSVVRGRGAARAARWANVSRRAHRRARAVSRRARGRGATSVSTCARFTRAHACVVARDVAPRSPTLRGRCDRRDGPAACGRRDGARRARACTSCRWRSAEHAALDATARGTRILAAATARVSATARVLAAATARVSASARVRATARARRRRRHGRARSSRARCDASRHAATPTRERATARAAAVAWRRSADAATGWEGTDPVRRLG